MPVTKPFKTIDEQIMILESRGVKVRDKKKSASILKRYNYFDVINGFESMLLDKGTLKKHYSGILFEDFSALFMFDMELKRATLFKILDIEARLRTSISHNFASIYCKNQADTMNYVDPGFYAAPPSIDKNLVNRFKSFDLFRKTQFYPTGKVKKKSFIDELKTTKDYIAQYVEPPFWVTIKALPLGTLYYLFIFLDNTVKQKVLADFGFSLSDEQTFIQALFVLKEVRNQCAHLELITRFRLKRHSALNNLKDVSLSAGLSKGDLNYMDVLKIFKLFGNVGELKQIIILFYLKLVFEGRKTVADKTIAKMGRKKITVWCRI